MRAAISVGTAATTAFWVAVRLRPSAEAMLETMLGDRTSAISETKLVAMRESTTKEHTPRFHYNTVHTRTKRSEGRINDSLQSKTDTTCALRVRCGAVTRSL